MSNHKNTPSNNRRFRRSHFLEQLSYSGNIHIPTSIDLIQYNEKGVRSKIIQPDSDLKKLIIPEYINWFKITGISDTSAILNICKLFEIKSFDIKDLLSAHNVTKVIAYTHQTFILMSYCAINDQSELIFSQVAFILGENYVISFQETPNPIFSEVMEAIKTNRVNVRNKSSDYLLYILLNNTHASFNDTLMRLTDKVNNMEDDLIDDNTQDINVMRFIQGRKREYSRLKRAVASLREEFINLLHNTNKLIKNENIMYFNDYDDKLRTSLDDLDAFSLSVSYLSDLYFNNNNMKINSVMQKLTIVSTIFIPLTFIVGVWGMNFEYMPELKWVHGYLFAWVIMAIIIILAIIYLKYKKWF